MQVSHSELLHVKEAAAELDVHEITVRRYIATGQLEAVRLGGRVRVRRQALEQFLQPYHRQEQP
jgi:excisionase family DNA binding protein